MVFCSSEEFYMASNCIPGQASGEQCSTECDCPDPDEDNWD